MRGRIGARLTLEIGCFLTFFTNVSQAGAIFNFVNFLGPGSGTNAGTGTNMNGIANTGAAVGFGIGNSGALTNFIRNPDGTFTPLNINGSTTAMALGVNSLGDVVGTVNGAAFFLPKGGSAQTIPNPATATVALGINDKGNIVGQYTTAGTTPGFFISDSAGNNLVTINAPAGPDTVNAQGVNDNGLIVGFYLGTDGQVHGFMADVGTAMGGMLTGTPIADPAIPPVMGEPGATFVFSQVLGINDSGIAVGYYGDSTTSQHGFLYDTKTGKYTFVDNPSEGFNNGVEVTQITGITNSGEITGFYTDANGVAHGFVGFPTPEPASLILAGPGLLALWLMARVRSARRRRSVTAIAQKFTAASTNA